MDKNTIFNTKITHPQPDKLYVVPMPDGIRQVHKDYGLWICKTLSKISFNPRSKISPRAFKFYALSHLIEGDGWYWNRKSGSVVRFEEGQGVLSTPGTVNFYSGYNKNYVEDSVCFTGPVADSLSKSGIIKDGIINIGKSRKLLPIMELASNPSRDSQIKANIELQSLLVELYFKNREMKEDKKSRIDELLLKISEDIEKVWTVSEMAEFCNLSVNHFRRVFTGHTALNPKEYVDTLKINKAIELLQSDEGLSVSEISNAVGFFDQYHFSRRFKELTGLSPMNYIRNIFKGRI